MLAALVRKDVVFAVPARGRFRTTLAELYYKTLRG